jgi:hypothetical protein
VSCQYGAACVSHLVAKAAGAEKAKTHARFQIERALSTPELMHWSRAMPRPASN